MKIAISANGTTPEADVDPRFGRCQYFMIADTDTGTFEAMDNSSAAAAGGAGISAARTIAGKGVEAVLTGNCGPNAHQVFTAAGIQVIPNVTGTVKDAVAAWKSGRYSASREANVPDHYGTGGRSSGMGRGMGGGGGRGMGMGRGMGGNFVEQPPAQQSASPEEDLKSLQEQSKVLSEQMADLQRRIDKLTNR